MTCISSLTNIAKQRSNYTTTVLQTFELLHGEAAAPSSPLPPIALSPLDYQLSSPPPPKTANLPAHFATSQISSVRKQLKVSVVWLLCHNLWSFCLFLWFFPDPSVESVKAALIL